MQKWMNEKASCEAANEWMNDNVTNGPADALEWIIEWKRHYVQINQTPKAKEARKS